MHARVLAHVHPTTLPPGFSTTCTSPVATMACILLTSDGQRWRRTEGVGYQVSVALGLFVGMLGVEC